MGIEYFGYTTCENASSRGPIIAGKVLDLDGIQHVVYPDHELVEHRVSPSLDSVLVLYKIYWLTAHTLVHCFRFQPPERLCD